MAKKINIGKSIETLEKAQKELIRRRIDAIRKLDMTVDEQLRNQMLALDGFRKDIETLFAQLNVYILKNRIIGGAPLKAAAEKSQIRKHKNQPRSKSLPEVGTKLHGKYKGKEYWGDITKNGIVIEGMDEAFPTMSAAAKAVTGKNTVSGWAFWKTISM